MSDNVVNLTSFDLPPRLITAINAFDDAIVKAINDAVNAGVHRGMIVGMLHGYTHDQASKLVDGGYK